MVIKLIKELGEKNGWAWWEFQQKIGNIIKYQLQVRELKNNITDLKNTQKYPLYDAEERFSELKGCGAHPILVAKRKRNEKKWRYLKRQVPKSSTPIFALLGLWEENREWKGQNTYLNKWWLKTSLNCGKKQTSRPRKLRKFQRYPYQDTL